MESIGKVMEDVGYNYLLILREITFYIGCVDNLPTYKCLRITPLICRYFIIYEILGIQYSSPDVIEVQVYIVECSVDSAQV